ncbi:unnamed protein product [Orchesella dallaii]|uniref:Retrotransposon gag domain-containing protein n=1 Tax=Orchesella dallaii TaxID=48710 RepID=A0ABP1QTK5_9HEXA
MSGSQDISPEKTYIEEVGQCFNLRSTENKFDRDRGLGLGTSSGPTSRISGSLHAAEIHKENVDGTVLHPNPNHSQRMEWYNERLNLKLQLQSMQLSLESQGKNLQFQAEMLANQRKEISELRDENSKLKTDYETNANASSFRGRSRDRHDSYAQGSRISWQNESRDREIIAPARSMESLKYSNTIASKQSQVDSVLSALRKASPEVPPENTGNGSQQRRNEHIASPNLRAPSVVDLTLGMNDDDYAHRKNLRYENGFGYKFSKNGNSFIPHNTPHTTKTDPIHVPSRSNFYIESTTGFSNPVGSGSLGSYSQRAYAGSNSNGFGMQRASSYERSSSNIATKPIMKHIDPPTYSGRSDNKSAYDFLEELKRYQNATAATHEMMLQVVIPFVLKCDAYRWYDTEQMLNPIFTWEDFVQRFRRKYQSHDYYEKLRREFDIRSQGELERLSDYIIVIIGYYKRLSRVVIDREVISKVLYGLHPTYFPFSKELCYLSTLQEFLDESQRIDDYVSRARNYKPPPTSNSIENSLQYTPFSTDGIEHKGSTNYQDKAYSTYCPAYSFSKSDKEETFSNADKPAIEIGTENVETHKDGKPNASEHANSTAIRHPSPYRTASQTSSRATSPSPTSILKNNNVQTKANVQCFRCQGNHYIRDCPVHPSNLGNRKSPDQKGQ